MKRLFALALAASASLVMFHADFADAARMGGGRSFGMQRSIAPSAIRPAPSAGALSGPAANPVMPAKPGVAAGSPAGAAAAAAPASRASRWLGPIAGLAAGLGLAALFSHFGLSDGLGSMLMMGLLVVGGIFLVRAFLARRSGATPFQYAGAPATAGSPPRAPIAAGTEQRIEPRIEPTWGATAAPAAGRYPPGFDAPPFLAQATLQFRRLQAAYDSGDHTALADVMTPEMQAQVARDIAERGAHVPTDIVALEADVVEVVRDGANYVATVRFHGSLREDGAATAQPFEEMWHLVKPVDGASGWLLAGIQQFA